MYDSSAFSRRCLAQHFVSASSPFSTKNSLARPLRGDLSFWNPFLVAVANACPYNSNAVALQTTFLGVEYEDDMAAVRIPSSLPCARLARHGKGTFYPLPFVGFLCHREGCQSFKTVPTSRERSARYWLWSCFLHSPPCSGYLVLSEVDGQPQTRQTHPAHQKGMPVASISFLVHHFPREHNRVVTLAHGN